MVAMRDAGLVVLDGDEVLCGEGPPNPSSVDDASAIPGTVSTGLRETVTLRNVSRFFQILG